MFKTRSSYLSLLLIPLGLLYLWLAYETVQTMAAGADFVSYAMLFIFAVLGIGAIAGGINIARGRR